MHEMPSSAPWAKSAGCGACSSRQRLPFQDSTKYSVLFAGLYSPIAVHALAELHDTPSSTTSTRLADQFGGLGVGSTRQFLPFHLSASVGPPGWLKSVP